jgi:hypothetical protein
MPTVKSGDRVTLKSGRSPLANQVPEWKDDRAFKPFEDDQQFEVLEVNGSKVKLEAIDHFESRPFAWFKNAVAKVWSANASEAVNTTKEPEPFRPSNSDQGYGFTSQWCDRCEKDINKNCPILMQALNGGAEEWIYQDGKPVCTAWQQRVTVKRVDDWDAPAPAFAQTTTRKVNPIHVSHNGVAIEFEERREPSSAQEQPTAKPLEFPVTQAEFSTAISLHKGCSYWVEGSHAKGKTPAQYYYCVQRNGTVTKSDVPYDSVHYAGRWAREAIDKLATIVEV